ncbi:MAG TPA: ABC transporter permease [Xanthobacteraceae bacterium]|nr:ABC transporter permease [Xanthobacteraceae bacterium]
MSALAANRAGGFWRRAGAMLLKEFLQLRRDRFTLATMISIPLIQLVMFGYAINTTPRDLPTAVLLQESSDVGRSILAALQNTKFFKVTRQLRDEAELDQVLASGAVLFAVEIPAGFERALRRGDEPALLVAADATDPVATGPAIAALSAIVATALVNDRWIPDSGQPPFEIRAHDRYNPAASTPLNIVPGLLGTILSLTMLIFTALSVTREVERGTMESLLAMPITPLEIMLGKIAPYVLVGFVQATLIVGAGVLLFGVPIVGNLALLAALTTLFIATNLSFGYTFSTLAQNQLQAVQMSMMFFLPNMLLSGFIFPFLGMPGWAQTIGEFLPLTHFIRIVRAIMLKGSTLPQLQYDSLALAGLMALAMIIAVTRFRRTLD